MTKVWPEGLEGVWPSDKQIEAEAQLHAETQREEMTRGYLRELSGHDLWEEVRFLERALVTLQSMGSPDVCATMKRYRLALGEMEQRANDSLAARIVERQCLARVEELVRTGGTLLGREFECMQRDTEVTIVVAESATEAAILYFEEVFGAGWPGMETIRVDDMRAMGTEHFQVVREGNRTVVLPND